MDQDWVYVIHPKKKKKEDKKKEKERWDTLSKICPHLMTPEKIGHLCRQINITNLENKLLSEKWVEYQLSGWSFEKVITKYDLYLYKDKDDYSLLSIQNKWGDYAVFKKLNRIPV